MLPHVGLVLLYGGAGKTEGWVIAIIVAVLLLALVGIFSLLRLGFGAVEPNLTPTQKEGASALPLLLLAVAVTVVICYFMASAVKS